MKNKINSITHKFGQILSAQRRHKKISLESIAKSLKIPFKYLEAMESNDFNNLPRHWKKMLVRYCGYLDLEAKAIWQIAKKDLKKIQFNRKKKNYFTSWPKIIRAVVLAGIVIGVLVFLGIKIDLIFAAPPLRILEPLDNSRTSSKQIKIIGESQKEAEITINNNPIFVDADGRFEAEINLQEDMNLIKITAKKKYSRIREANLRILLAPEGSS